VTKALFLLGVAFAFVSVTAGAFGAHGLRAQLEPARLATFETAARYQMYHALALVGVSLAASRWPDGWWSVGGVLFTAGTIFFCGSLYALSLTGARWLGAIAPLGGVCFLAGWLAVLVAALRSGMGSG
jgi:uncharacterized membrane protein YgdD (TMEM256/DUF423 family)